MEYGVYITNPSYFYFRSIFFHPKTVDLLNMYLYLKSKVQHGVCNVIWLQNSSSRWTLTTCHNSSAFAVCRQPKTSSFPKSNHKPGPITLRTISSTMSISNGYSNLIRWDLWTDARKLIQKFIFPSFSSSHWNSEAIYFYLSVKNPLR